MANQAVSTEPIRVLLIEDDYRLATMVRTYLADSAITVTVADNAASGLLHLQKSAFDLVLLDLMLPDGNGLQICQTIREHYPTPVMMLTAKGDLADRVVGLEMGADDYLAKPFEPRELLARIRAVLRRGQNPHSQRPLVFGRLEIDTAARQVMIDTKRCDFTARQFDLLLCLAKHAGRVMSREQLARLTGSDGFDGLDRAIDVHIARLRAEIEDDVKTPRRIVTVRGAGYVFAASQD
jgi:two-component system, OmpR family, phosphate regulon response regulator OmpR